MTRPEVIMQAIKTTVKETTITPEELGRIADFLQSKHFIGLCSKTSLEDLSDWIRAMKMQDIFYSFIMEFGMHLDLYGIGMEEVGRRFIFNNNLLKGLVDERSEVFDIYKADSQAGYAYDVIGYIFLLRIYFQTFAGAILIKSKPVTGI